jgi:NADH dehydrogenase
MDRSKNIVIIGGGFAGTTLARALERDLPAGHELLLISEESYTTFNPMLAEAVGASVFPEQVVAPIRQIVAGTRFIMGRVTTLDPAHQTLRCETLAGPRDIAWEHCVLAFGNRARLDLLPGLAEHALPLKTVGDALHIRNVVLQRLARIELETDATVRRRLGHFIVIGGGFSGVETAGALADCLQSAARYYPRIVAGELSITLLQDLDRLLPELPESLGRAAHRSLAARGVIVRRGSRATCVGEKGVLLADGEFLPSATVLCTIGTRPNPLVERMLVPTMRGRIVVNPDLSVAGSPGLWAVGDCALVRNEADNTYAPPTAQFAVAEARTLASNLRASLAGAPTRAFRYRSRGAMAAIGHRTGVAEVFGVRITGLAAWLAWRAYYLSRMPTLGRKIRIFVEWSWAMFFPTDITHLRFTRSSEVDERASGAVSAPALPVDDAEPIRRTIAESTPA